MKEYNLKNCGKCGELQIWEVKSKNNKMFCRKCGMEIGINVNILQKPKQYI